MYRRWSDHWSFSFLRCIYFPYSIAQTLKYHTFKRPTSVLADGIPTTIDDMNKIESKMLEMISPNESIPATVLYAPIINTSKKFEANFPYFAWYTHSLVHTHKYKKKHKKKFTICKFAEKHYCVQIHRGSELQCVVNKNWPVCKPL